MDQPGKPDADAGADLQNAATARYRCGECRQQPAHFDLARELEPSAGGSFVRGQNAAGKLLALGHKKNNAGYRGAGSMVLPDGLPDPAIIAALGAEVALVHARFDHLQAQLSRLAGGPAASTPYSRQDLLQPARTSASFACPVAVLS